MRSLLMLSAVTVFTATFGAAADQNDNPAAAPTSPPVTDWPKPIMLPIKLPPSGQSSDWTQISFVAGKGFVGGSPETLSSIGRPLSGLTDQGRIAEVCKKAVWKSAAEAGADSIEAIPQAPDRRVAGGQSFAPVTMRISYTRQSMIEVKKSTVICVVDKVGRFVDAYAPEKNYIVSEDHRDGSNIRWSSLTRPAGLR